VYSIQHAIKFVSDLGQVGGFLEVSTINKTDHHDIAEILLRLVLNSITQTIRYRKYSLGLFLKSLIMNSNRKLGLYNTTGKSRFRLWETT
jgi:hypothetical protein